jgi:type II secretory ATPase GspE/PulE/Tfp pilus assembly ATPase PilB-like protein
VGITFAAALRHILRQDPDVIIIVNEIRAAPTPPEIKHEAVKNGMRTLRQSALRKLAEGQTTFEEVVRVTGL